jgi:integrase
MKIKAATRKRGTVTVGTDKGCLRLQFPSSVSKLIWNRPQKYKSLGLSNTPENRAMAEKLASIAQLDILSDNLDISLEKYNPHALKKTLEQVQPKIPGLLNLYTKYLETVIKPGVSPTTYKNRYASNYLNAIKACPDANIITDALQIRDTISQMRAPATTRGLLDTLYNLMEWAVRNKIIPNRGENPYKALKKDIRGQAQYLVPQHISQNGMNKTVNEYKGFLPREALAIIEAFEVRGKPKGMYRDAVEFLFLTGCRTGECFGLRWEDINEDCTEITFRHSYSPSIDSIKELKNARFGKEKKIRSFSCSTKLQQFLLNKRELKKPSPLDFVFGDGKQPLNQLNFHGIWAGISSSTRRKYGVIEELISEGKVRFYLKPYASRHSFITWQLKAGMTPANVAKIVGTSVEMIYRNYVSADEDTNVVMEI